MGAVRSAADRPAHWRAGVWPWRVSPRIGRGAGVTLGPYQQSGAAEAGWVWASRLGRRERWPGNGRPGGRREPQWRWLRRLGALSAAWGGPSPEAVGVAGPHRTAGRLWSEPRARQVSVSGVGAAEVARPPPPAQRAGKCGRRSVCAEGWGAAWGRDASPRGRALVP